MVKNRGRELFEFLKICRQNKAVIPENTIFFESVYQNKISPREYRVYFVKDCQLSDESNTGCCFKGKISEFTISLTPEKEIEPLKLPLYPKEINFTSPGDFSYVFILFPKNITREQFNNFLTSTFEEEGGIAKDTAKKITEHIAEHIEDLMVFMTTD